MGEEILGHAVWIDFERKLDVTFDSVGYFVGCFPSILGDQDEVNSCWVPYIWKCMKISFLHLHWNVVWLKLFMQLETKGQIVVL